MLSGLTEWVTDVVEAAGYLGVALLIALESIFPPIPSEVVLTLAGFVAGQGDAWVVGMIVAATVGSLVGAWALYAIAAAIGPERLHGFITKHGRWCRITEADLTRSEAWFDDHAGTAVLICRCVPLIRSLVSIPAGFRRMPLAKFTLFTLIGSAVWNTALVLAGYALRDQWEKVAEIVDYFQVVVILAIVGAVSWFVYRRFIAAPKTEAVASPDD